MVGGIGHHACTQRVEFDVPMAVHQILPVLDRAGLVAPFPQGSRAVISLVDAADISPSQRLHHSADRPARRGRDEQVYVVRHQDVGVNGAAFAEGDVPEVVSIAEVVRVGEEAGLAIVSVLDDMLRDIRDVDSGRTRHVRAV